MKNRFKIALKEVGLSIKEAAEILELKYDTLRKSIDRGSINFGYLIILEEKTGISRSYIKNGELPILTNKKNEFNSTTEIQKLSKEDIINFRNTLLVHESQLLEDTVISQWLALKLLKKENEIHLEYKTNQK